jgi:hypothetical protein
MNDTVKLPEEHIPADRLQRLLDAIEGYMYLKLPQEAFEEWSQITPAEQREDPRLREMPPAVKALFKWIAQRLVLTNMDFSISAQMGWTKPQA